LSRAIVIGAKPIAVGAKPIAVGAKPIAVGAKPIAVGAKAIAVGAKAIAVGAKAITIGAKPITADGKPITADGKRAEDRRQHPATIIRRYVFRAPLPQGAKEIRVRAVAYDGYLLGSAPVELSLRDPNARPVKGNLYALCVGIASYKKGVSLQAGQKPARGQIPNLAYPGRDALEMAARLRREAKGFYDNVEVLTLTNQGATLKSLRAGLQWLQRKARPGQVDTCVMFLSGHGFSDARGEYYFPAWEGDAAGLRFLKATSLSGQELQAALGAKLPARDAFLFVDSCHSGALASTPAFGRGAVSSDDLSFEVKNSGVYLLASSGASQHSFESSAWQHGAFTTALLSSLADQQQARDGLIHFDVLTYLVPLRVGALMKEIGLSENAETPVVPLEGRYLDEPVAKAQK
jgi:hypothetical protein